MNRHWYYYPYHLHEPPLILPLPPPRSTIDITLTTSMKRHWYYYPYHLHEPPLILLPLPPPRSAIDITLTTSKKHRWYYPYHLRHYPRPRKIYVYLAFWLEVSIPMITGYCMNLISLSLCLMMILWHNNTWQPLWPHTVSNLCAIYVLYPMSVSYTHLTLPTIYSV